MLLGFYSRKYANKLLLTIYSIHSCFDNCTGTLVPLYKYWNYYIIFNKYISGRGLNDVILIVDCCEYCSWNFLFKNDVAIDVCVRKIYSSLLL